MLGRSENQIFLAAEVMEETALSQSGGRADVLDTSSGIWAVTEFIPAGIGDSCSTGLLAAA